MATGVPGHLLDVATSNNTNMLLVATSGAYWSTNGAAAWSLCAPADPGQLAVFQRSRFRACTSLAANGVIVGQDTVLQQAVIFNHVFATSTTSLVFTGAAGTALRACGGSAPWTAVGDDGLVVYTSVPGGVWNIRAPFTAQDLGCVVLDPGGLLIGGDSCLYHLNTVQAVPTIEHGAPVTDVDRTSGNYGHAVADGLLLRGISLWPQVTSFDAPLDATCVDHYVGTFTCLVGTTDGIRQGTGVTTVLQRQPSADGYQVNSIVASGTDHGWAACNDGWLLSTTNKGGTPLPYVHFLAPNGACTGTPMTFQNQGASGTQWTWNVNGNNVGTAFNYTTSFATAGLYTVTLTGTTSAGSSSFARTFWVVPPPPATPVPYSVNDTLFCKQGESIVTLAATDTAYRYALIRLHDDHLLDIAFGTGGPVVLSSGVQTDSCLLGIERRSTIADCGTLSPDTIPLHIEQTRAAFRTGKLNMVLGDTVIMHNNSEQAVVWEWSFGAGAVPATATSEHPETVYPGAGATTVTLVAISAEGCTDTVTAPGAVVHDPATLEEECWAYRTSTWTSTSTFTNGQNCVNSMYWHPHEQALYVAGYTDRSRLESRAGVGFTAPQADKGGAYQARYDRHGLLQWCIYGGNEWSSGSSAYAWTPAFFLPSRSSGDALLLTQAWNTDDTIRFPNGDYKYLGLGPSDLVRVDRHGRPLWSAFMRLDVRAMVLDAQDNIYLTARMPNPNYEYISPTGVQTPFPQGPAAVVVKLNAQGEYLWHVGVDVVVINYDVLTDLAVVDNGRLIVVGHMQHHPTFGSTDGNPITLDLGTDNTNTHAVIAEYDTAGVLQWVHEIDDTRAYGVATDANGNVYASLYPDPFTSDFVFPSNNAVPFMLNDRFPTLCSYTPGGDFRWVATASDRMDVIGGDIICTDDGAVLQSGYDYNGGHFAVDRNGWPALDSVWAQYRALLMVRWDTAGYLQGMSTQEGDSALTSVHMGGDPKLQLSAGDGPGYYVGISFMPFSDATVPVLGDTLQGDTDHYYMVLGHMSTDLCNPGVPLAVPAAPAAPGPLVFPLPADDFVRISARAGMVGVFDATGREVFRAQVTADPITVDVGRWPSGFYTAVFQDGLVRHRRPFVVAH